ncbi:hypothetical protein Cni_G09029 [Canna indica]|uniref:Phylloplanin n=1 Tax=Canna indica TaxID=4628 RepID=A0AAQ3Q8F8_9LILI|nr:hypothetical protein Cni_G09029 [Canna indica]
MASTTSCLLLVLATVAVLAPGAAVAQLLGNIFSINGTIPCRMDPATLVTSPVFPNATVLLQCGTDVLASTTSNRDGVFNILLNPTAMVLSTLLSSCKLVVTTPLSLCNASLPSSGILQSTLNALPSNLFSLLGGVLVNIVPTNFAYRP